MRGLKIASIRLAFYEDEHNAGAQVTVEWAHDMVSSAQVLRMCGGVELQPVAMLGSHSAEYKGLKTVRTFRFESREDALEAYDKFEENLRGQQKDKLLEVKPLDADL